MADRLMRLSGNAAPLLARPLLRPARLAMAALLMPMFMAAVWMPCAVVADVVGASPIVSTGADPTRPPPSLLAPVDDAPAQAGEVQASGLQTIIRRAGAKPVAIINGEHVVLGGKVGDARLVSLGETEAVLQGPNGKEVLRMTPGVNIRPVVAPLPPRPAKIKASKKKKAKASKAKPKSTETE